MKLVKDYLHLDIDLKGSLKKSLNVGDKQVDLILDNVFSRYEEDGTMPADFRNLIHKGKLIGKPRGLSSFVKKDEITLDEVDVGDTIYFHHMVVSFDRRTEEGTFFFRYFRDMVTKKVCSAYCKVTPEGEVIPIHKWTICRKFKTVFESTTLIIPDHLRTQKREDLLEVITPSRFIKDEVSPGDIIVVNKNGIYEINVEGEDYVFIHTDDLYGIKLD